MGLEGKRIAVLAEDLYQELELWYPVLRMREAGATVNIVGPRKGAFHSKNGYPAEADTAIDDVKSSDFDAVIVPGGYAPDMMRRNAGMIALVREAHEQGKVVASICHAGWVLVSAGILKGKRATSVSAIKDDMVNAGAQWVDEEVVVDGNLITSRTPPDLPAFCREIIKALQA
jgi:protease I